MTMMIGITRANCMQIMMTTGHNQKKTVPTVPSSWPPKTCRSPTNRDLSGKIPCRKLTYPLGKGYVSSQEDASNSKKNAKSVGPSFIGHREDVDIYSFLMVTIYSSNCQVTTSGFHQIQLLTSAAVLLLLSAGLRALLVEPTSWKNDSMECLSSIRVGKKYHRSITATDWKNGTNRTWV